MAVLDITKKAAIYHILYEINSSFAAIVEQYQSLRESGMLSARFTRRYQGFTRELQAEFNQDFLLALHDVEMDDWNHFGKVRKKWEKHLKGPGNGGAAGRGKKDRKAGAAGESRKR